MKEKKRLKYQETIQCFIKVNQKYLENIPAQASNHK